MPFLFLPVNNLYKTPPVRLFSPAFSPCGSCGVISSVMLSVCTSTGITEKGKKEREKLGRLKGYLNTSSVLMKPHRLRRLRHLPSSRLITNSGKYEQIRQTLKPERRVESGNEAVARQKTRGAARRRTFPGLSHRSHRRRTKNIVQSSNRADDRLNQHRMMERHV